MRGYLAVIAITVTVPAVANATGEAVDGFPNWEERVMHEWANRARCDPQVEMTACGSDCGEASCYSPKPPLSWSENLNHAARFHSDEMDAQGYFAHDSQCAVVSNIDSLYPSSCQGAASCACTSGPNTAWGDRVALFGTGAKGEIISSYADPNGAFYQWLFEGYSGTTCGYNSENGHRWNILENGSSIGFGHGAGASVGDFGDGDAPAKIPSGSHYPRQAASVEAWANWNDSAGPMFALVNVDGECTPLSLQRGTVTNGAYKADVTGVGSGCHRYFFLFKDSAGAIVTFPTTGSLGIGPAGSCADWDSTRPSTGASCNCAPQCAGATCGDDGCGGSCGNCANGESCESGTCVTGGGNNNNGDGGPNDGEDATGGCCDSGSHGDLATVLWAAILGLAVGRRRRPRSASL